MSKRSYWLVALVVVIVVAALAFILLKDHHRLASTKIPSTHSSTTNKSAGASSAKSSDKATPLSGNSDVSSKNAQSGSSSSQTQSVTLLAPSGTFISNHHPGQNGTPTAEASICNTTPGATCYIQFTMGSTTKKLDSETANSNGTATWYWDVSDAGFTKGSWQVSAVASLSGQTQTSQDPNQLEVQ